MRKLKKFGRIILIGAILCGVLLMSNPLRWPENILHKRILRMTPLGMSMEDVLGVVEAQNTWRILNINYERGYINPDAPQSGSFAFSEKVIVGEKFVWVLIGEYPRILASTTVTVFWGFDTNSKLIGVDVQKDTDGP